MYHGANGFRGVLGAIHSEKMNVMNRAEREINRLQVPDGDGSWKINDSLGSAYLINGNVSVKNHLKLI